MSKKIKIFAVLFAVLSVLLIGNNVKALDFNDFQTAVQSSEAQYGTIDLNNYDNPLTFTVALTVAANKVFVGKTGANFAVLSGNQNYRAFIIDNKTVQFYDHFTFQQFKSADSSFPNVIDASNNAIVNFTTGIFSFINNALEASNDLSAISVKSSSINFSGSSVTFANNSGRSASTIFARGSTVTFINSTVNVLNNKVNSIGNSTSYNFYLDGMSKIAFESSLVNFIDNHHVYAQIYIENSSTLAFTNSIVTFSSGIGAYIAGALRNYRGFVEFKNSTINFTINSSLNIGGAINSDEYGKVSFYNSIVVFTSNSANANNNPAGGAIYISNSDIIFVGSTVSFIRNRATRGFGGAFYAEGANINFANSKVSFILNEAVAKGGAFYAKNSRVNFTNSAVNFRANEITNNSDVYAGGALYAEAGSVVNFTGSTISFAHNKATNQQNGGGAVFVHKSSVNFTNSRVEFIKNESIGLGGAIYLRESNANVSFTNSIVDFTSNAANYTGGGAISAVQANAKINFIGSEVNFIRNESLEEDYGNGGALYLANTGTTGNFDASRVNFINNAAKATGGAVYVYNGAIVNFTNSRVNFTGNDSADMGGAIGLQSANASVNFTNSSAAFTNNRAANSGGAIFAFTNPTINIERSTITFLHNAANATNGGGGAIYLISRIIVNVTDSQVDFIDNVAISADGGAIHANTSSISFTHSIVNFTTNTAANNGGAIYAQNSTVNFINSQVNFTSNNVNSANAGGAIYAKSSNINFTGGTSYFMRNRAGNGYAGAIYADGGSSVSFTNSIVNFIFNTAKEGGGAISALNSKVNFTNSAVNFRANETTNNSASKAGAALLAEEGSVVNFTGSTISFAQNKEVSEAYGGAVFVYKSSVNFTNSRVDFTNNEAAGGSGGAIYLIESKAIVNFTNSIVNFTGNYSANMGGAIYLKERNAIVNFTNSSASFTNNRALNSGGAISVHISSNVNIAHSTITFLHNTANTENGGGGALYAQSSTVTFTDSRVDFKDNVAIRDDGGAINAYISNIAFTRSIVNFTTNTAGGYGGAIYAQNSTVNFTNSAVNFTTNTASGGYGGAIYASAAPISFANLTASFIGNRANQKGAAIYVENTTISFINTNASFIGNSGSAALSAKSNQIRISGDMEFSANGNGDIELEWANILFMPERGKDIKFKGDIADKGGVNEILKIGEGAVIFDAATPIHLPNVKFTIEQGTAHFSASSNTFNELKISSVAILGISIDFRYADPLISAIYVSAINVSSGAALSVRTAGIAELGTAEPFVYANYLIGQEADFENMNIIDTGGYEYDLSWEEDNGEKIGYLTLKGLPPPILPSALFAISPVFIANTIRASAISDNSAIYSNMDEDAWGAVQINGGSLADDDLGDFKNSAVGIKAGFRVFNKEGKTAGVFAGLGSRSYKQGGNKAAASDIDFGAYGSWAGISPKINLAGFFGFGLQAVKAEGGGSSAEFDASVIKFGAKAEYAAGLISPFIGFESAIARTDDINLDGATLAGGSYTRLSSQFGAKIVKSAGKLDWHGKAYLDLLLAGRMAQYSVKPDAASSRDIDATAEVPIYLGLGGGASLPVSETVDVFANAEIKLNADYFGYQTNIGGRFKF